MEKGIFTFSTAAKLAGIREKALRGWLDRNQVQYPSLATRGENSWRRFTLMDVLHLAIVAEVIKYDFRIEFADEVARTVTGGVKIMVIDGIGTPDSASLSRLIKLVIQLRHSESRVNGFVASDEIVPQDKQEQYGAYFVIKPFRILREIGERLPLTNRIKLTNEDFTHITDGMKKAMDESIRKLNAKTLVSSESGPAPKRKTARNA